MSERLCGRSTHATRLVPKGFLCSVALEPRSSHFSQALILAGPTQAQQKTVDLANQSLEDLMNVKVVSFLRTEETISRTAAAIFVITQEEDIRRSGATNNPDLLRIAPGMDVAQIEANTWAIRARGLNARFSNELS